MLDEQNPHKSKCIRCDTCDAFACVVQAKADAHVVCVEPALATGNVTIVTGAFVKRLEPNRSIYPKTLALSDFYFASKEWEYPMGFIQMLGKTNVEDLRYEARDLHVMDDMTLEDLARRSLDFWLQLEDLPDPNNRVTLNRDGLKANDYLIKVLSFEF